MRFGQLHQRVRAAGYRVSYETLARIVDRLGASHIGSGWSRHYSELDYRRVISYLRISQLTGPSNRPNHTIKALHRAAIELLAHHTAGYVAVTADAVAWTQNPPLEAIRSGVTTCWPVWE